MSRGLTAEEMREQERRGVPLDNPFRPRLASKSFDKLVALKHLAEVAIAAGVLDKFPSIEISLTWDNVPDRGGTPDEDEGTVVPIVIVKLGGKS